MKYLSVCSGIEAASVAWHGFGWQPLAFSEIEAFPRAVLAHHYPDVPLHGDFTKLRDEAWVGNADILVGGTPCQAFSVAGLRNSLADDRGNLTLEFVRLADAIDDARLNDGREPAIIVWENVPGVLSVKDNAFGCFLAALAGEDTTIVPHGGRWTDAGVVAGPRRAIAWRILDAQYFGLAQRRRRVFVVASARDGFDSAAVLLEFEGVRRDTPPRREAGQGFTHSIAPSLTSSGRGVERGGDTRGQDPVIAVMPSTGDISHCLNAGGMGRQDYETETLVTHFLRGEGFDASEDGTGRGTPLVPVCEPYAFPWQVGGTLGMSGTLGKNQTMAVAVPLQEVGKRTGTSTDDPRAGIGIGEDGDPMYTLQAGAQHGIATAIPFDTTQITSPSNYSKPKDGDPCHPLASGAHPPAVAVSLRGREGGGTGRRCAERPPRIAGRSMGEVEDQSPTVTTHQIGQGVMTNMAVRRLTPTECERLQGFPDGYTMIPWKKKPASECPDGPRYKALGNSMAVPVMRWIGQRIAAELSRASLPRKDHAA